MNILQILPSLEVGGVETGTLDLARHLVLTGHKAIVVSGGGSLVGELEKMGARHYTLPVGRKSIFNIIRMVGELSAIIKSEDIDIVHARSRIPAWIAYFASRATNRIFITTAHGYYSKHFMSKSMGFGKYVIVASNIMARHMMESFGVSYERIRLIPRGVDLGKFHFTASDREISDGSTGKNFVIGMVSRITPLKGHADFIKAISILRRRIPNVRVKIVGSAPKEKYREDLEVLVKRLGLSQVIEFIPARQDVFKVMSEFNVLVMATTTPEAFGRVIIEAQAVGVPVVATRVGGVVDIIEDGVTGILCNSHNPQDMADKIHKVYKDNDMVSRMIPKARERVEREFGLEKMLSRTMHVYHEAMAKRNILIIKLSAIGDVILSVPSLRAIRKKFPGANIKVLVGSRSREALDGCPYINGVIVADFDKRHKGCKGFLKLAGDLRGESFDIVFDLQNNRKSHILSFLSLAPLRYGYDNGKASFLLNKKVDDKARFLNPVDHQFRVLGMAGIKSEEKYLELWPSEEDKKYAEKFLEDNWVGRDQILAGINIGASAKWVTKNWPAINIARLSDVLARDYNARVILTGTEEDILQAERIARASSSKPIIAAGRTSIMELACLIKKCRVFLTPDSAPMHIASAVGTGCVALFGPTDPVRHAVASKDMVILSKSSEMKCAPCYRAQCAKKVACMNKITLEDVAAAMRPYLER